MLAIIFVILIKRQAEYGIMLTSSDVRVRFDRSCLRDISGFIIRDIKLTPDRFERWIPQEWRIKGSV